MNSELTHLEQEKELLSLLQDESNFSERSKPFRLSVLYGDQKIMALTQSVICGVIRDRQATPVSKLLALRLTKLLIETFNDNFISVMQGTILPLVEKIALYNHQSKEEDRGQTIFSERVDDSNQELSELGTTYHRLALELIFVWSKWFVVDPDTAKLSCYFVTYSRLKMIGVTFHKVLYFEPSEILQNLPESSPPIRMILQMRELLKKEVTKGISKMRSTKRICRELNVTLPLFQLYGLQEEYETYRDIFQRFVRIVIRSSLNPLCNQKNPIPVFKSIIPPQKNFQPQSIVEPKASPNQMSFVSDYQDHSKIQSQIDQTSKLQQTIIQLQNEKMILMTENQEKTKQIAQLNNKLRKLNRDFETMKTTKLIQTDNQSDGKDDIELCQSRQLEIENKSLKEINTELRQRVQQQELERSIQDDETVKRLSISPFEQNDKQEQKYRFFKNMLTQVKTLLSQSQQQAIGYREQIKILKQELQRHGNYFQEDQDSMYTLTPGGPKINSNQLIYKRESVWDVKSNLHDMMSYLNRRDSQCVNYFRIPVSSLNAKFKQACLLEKTLLYQNGVLQIGVITQHQLTVNIFFTNKSNYLIDNLQIKYTKSAAGIVADLHPVQTPTFLESGKVFNQRFIFKLTDLNYNIIVCSVQFKQGGINFSANVAIPMTINKFFIYQKLPVLIHDDFQKSSAEFPAGMSNQLSMLLSSFNFVKDAEHTACAYVQVLGLYFLIKIVIKNDHFLTIKVQYPHENDQTSKIADNIINTYVELLHR